MAFNITKIVGKKVEEKEVYNAAITDTTTKWVPVDSSNYANFNLIVHNTLDKPVDLYLYYSGSYVSYAWDGEKFIRLDVNPLTLSTSGSFPIMEHPVFAPLKDKCNYGFRIKVVCPEAPTTGSLKITIHGRVN